MRQSNYNRKGFVVLVIIVCATLTSAFAFTSITKSEFTYDLKTFSSYDELASFLQDLSDNYSNGGGQIGLMESMDAAAPRSSEAKNTFSWEGDAGSVDYSETNVQVEGVDEPDIVKTDGTYIYVVAESSIFIVLAYPADEARILSEISFDDEMIPENLFVNDDRLVVLGSSYQYYNMDEYSKSEDSLYWWGGYSSTMIKVYDIGDRTEPELVRDVKVDGYYFDGRMIDDYVYVLASEYTYLYYLENSNNTRIPGMIVDGEKIDLPPDEIYYCDIPESPDTMTYVISFNVLDDHEDVTEKGFLLGNAQSIYVSRDDFYITYTKYNYNTFWGLQVDATSGNSVTTLIHRIAIHNGDTSYDAQGEVPGSVHDQFSMDEHDGFFRIATTEGWGDSSENNVYILDLDLEVVSEIENIAPGESIYSARFIGDCAYLVTFQKIDPFFTIDLSDPYNPEILGELKIPGYSDYLHPFDDDHIIGIGKDTVEPQEEEGWWSSRSFAWYQGLKIAMFDVSDFDDPKVLDQEIIGDRGTDSPALHDHKAFLFDRSKELLVIPVSVYVIDDEIKEQNEGYTGSTYGEFEFQGAYVYTLNLDGFDYKGRITHRDDDDLENDRWYYRSSSEITRTLYIGDVLYTVSDEMIKMNDLYDLDEINSVTLS